MTPSCQKVLLSLHASGLKNVAGAFKGTSDPFAIVTLIASGPNEKPSILGKTEVIKNTLSPDWSTSFLFDYEIGKETHINVSIVDEVRKKTDKPMGSAVFEIGEILGSSGNIKAKKMKKGGTLFVHVQKAPPQPAGNLAIKLRGVKLKNVEGLFKKSDPFFELSRTHGSQARDVVYRSRHVKNNLNPQWEPATVDINALCDGDLNRLILVSIFDHESDGKHEKMGSFETSVNALVKASGNKGNFAPKNAKNKTVGTIVVDEGKIIPPPGGFGATTTVKPNAKVTTAPGVVPVPVPTSQFGNMSMNPPPPKPTFVDYISGNCHLNMTVAIDFTGSNGDPRQPGTLHHFYPDGRMNDYEKAITACGNILAKYDTNQRFPVVGFGAKYGGVVRHAFQVGQQSEVHGVNGILEAYKGVFRTPLTMSGPTVFTEVIALAASQARTAQQQNPLSYTILLLLTDGAVSDVEATKRAIAAVADAPISIVIVGIGNADFSAMQFLDDFEKRAGMQRDVVQFVQFNAHQHNKTSLTRATLEEIPEQLVNFFHARNIMPSKMTRRDSQIIPEEYNEDVDIDLSMDFSNPDGEIVLTGDQSGAHHDNSWEAGRTNNHGAPANVAPAMPMPSAPPTNFAASLPPAVANAAPAYAAPPANFAASAPAYAAPPANFAAAAPAYGAPPAMYAQPGAPAVATAVAPPQPSVFQVQVPPGIAPGMQIQVQNPQTGQMLVVAVPQGVPPGGVFSVSA